MGVIVIVVIVVIVIVVTGGKQSQLLASALGLGWSLTIPWGMLRLYTEPEFFLTNTYESVQMNIFICNSYVDDYSQVHTIYMLS